MSEPSPQAEARDMERATAMSPLLPLPPPLTWAACTEQEPFESRRPFACGFFCPGSPGCPVPRSHLVGSDLCVHLCDTLSSFKKRTLSHLSPQSP